MVTATQDPMSMVLLPTYWYHDPTLTSNQGFTVLDILRSILYENGKLREELKLIVETLASQLGKEPTLESLCSAHWQI